MTTLPTDSELGPALQMARGVQWHLGTTGDPYALLLRAQSDDPAPWHRRLRENGPVHVSALGAYVVTGHEPAAALLADRRLDVCPPDGTPAPWTLPVGAGLPLPGRAERDRLAEVAAHVFGPPAVARWEPFVAEQCARLLDEAGPHDFDLITDYAARAPVTVAAAVLGLSAERFGQYAALCADIRGLLDAVVCPQRLDVAQGILRAVQSLDELLREDRVAQRLIPEDHEAARAAAFLITAVAVPAAGNLIGNTALALLAGAEAGGTGAWQRLRTEPGLAAAAVAESLRHDPPVRLEIRYAQQELEIDGVPVPAGSQVVVVLGATGRDPGAYPDADRFDVTRFAGAATGVPRPLALGPESGHGIVAALVRMQAETAVRTLAGRRPALRRTGPVLRHRRSPVLGDLIRVPVAV
jgi:P450-derived glycosyltransferase activator